MAKKETEVERVARILSDLLGTSAQANEGLSKELTWLVKNKEYLKVDKIERQLSMPQGTLKKFVDGKRGLANRWHSRVVIWVNNIRDLSCIGTIGAISTSANKEDISIMDDPY